MNVKNLLGSIDDEGIIVIDPVTDTGSYITKETLATALGGVTLQQYNAFRAAITDAASGRSQLGLGTAAQNNTGDFIPAVSSPAANNLLVLNADGTLSKAGSDVYWETDAQGRSLVPSLARSSTVLRLGSGAASSNTTGSTWLAMGYRAGYSNTTGSSWLAIGYRAGYSNTTGDTWLAIGYRAGYSNTTGSDWFAMGYQTGYSNTTGSSWLAMGYRAGYLNTTGSSWLAIGTNAGYSNTTGDTWLAMGTNAGYSNTTGSSWLAIGYRAGYSNTTGSNWFAMGYQTGYSNTTGSNWLAIGFQAGYYVGATGTTPNTTATNFIAIGSGARLSADGTDGEMVIGTDAVGLGSNTAKFGKNGMSKVALSDIAIFTTSVPASASATGVTGSVAFDSNYVYRCTATNTWKRAALSTW